MLGYTLLNSVMYFLATGVSGVQPHQVTVPEAAALLEPPVDFPPAPPPQAASARTMPAAAINVMTGRVVLLIVVFLSMTALSLHDCLITIKARAQAPENRQRQTRDRGPSPNPGPVALLPTPEVAGDPSAP